jgi:tRNA threonylcarbamoyl adenosine modification protein YeaZ
MIVAVEAASTDLSVAIADGDGAVLAESAWNSDRRQSAELLPGLLGLLDRERRRLADVTGVAVGTGPGSFTGLRVAMALGKGLAFGLACPIVGIPSLWAWLESEPGAPAAVARAGAREAFVLLRGEDMPSVLGVEEVARRFATAPVVAPGELAATFGLPASVRPRGAISVAVEAARRLATDPNGDDLRSLDPAYLRLPRGVVAETPEVAPWR